MDFSESTAPRLLEASNVSNVPPLSAVVTTTRPGFLVNNNLFRRYAGNFTSSTRIGCQNDVHSRSIIYEIGQRTNDTNVFFGRPDAALCINQDIKLLDAQSAKIMEYTGKNTNFTGVFHTADLAALGFSLAAAVAHYATTGELTCAMMRAGNGIAVRAVSTRDDPVSVLDHGLFIPRNISPVDVNGVFAALAAAANGAGSTVYTDTVVTDNNNNAPILMEPVGINLAYACCVGLRILLAVYGDAGCGATMALAITRGMHSVCTVVGHTDEGGYMRSVLRQGVYSAPRGGLAPTAGSVETYIGLPMPNRAMPATFASMVDSILLATAAAVSISDPLTEVGGRMYPTIFSSLIGNLAEPGSHIVGDDRDARSLSSQIAGDCGDFASAYTSVLAKIFMVDNHNDRTASSYLQACFGTLAGSDDRHLRHKVVAPFFWIEPTTLLRDDYGTVAERNSYGQLANVGVPKEVPTFESAALVHGRAVDDLVAVSWRSMRTNGLMVHLNGHPLNGLAGVVPSQFQKNLMTLTGGNEVLDIMRSNGDGVDQYAWTRGQSGIAAPAEAMYLGKLMGLRCTWASLDMDTGAIRNEHFPRFTEFSQSMVRYEATAPTRLNDGRNNEPNRACRRARSQATSALDDARARLRASMATGGELWAVGDMEPSIREAPVDQLPVGLSVFERAEVEPHAPALPQRGPPVRIITHDSAAKTRAPAAAPNAAAMMARVQRPAQGNNAEAGPVDQEPIAGVPLPENGGDNPGGVPQPPGNQ